MERKLPTGPFGRAHGYSVVRLLGLIYAGRIPPPEKDLAGRYLWGQEDLENVRRALAVDHRRKEHRHQQTAMI
jgi:hypothetical protein